MLALQLYNTLLGKKHSMCSQDTAAEVCLPGMPINQSVEFMVQIGDPDVTHQTSWPESTHGYSVQRHMVSIVLQEEAEATLV